MAIPKPGFDNRHGGSAATMTDAELLKMAQSAVAAHLKPLARIAARHDAVPGEPTLAMRAANNDDTLEKELAKQIGATLGGTEPNSADVEFVEHTVLGNRTTVVHIRNGAIAQVLKRG